MQFLKKFWWLILIILVVLAAIIAVIRGTLRNAESSQRYENKDVVENKIISVMDERLPECPNYEEGLLTHEVFDINELDFVVPLGMLAAGGHTIPTDHMALNHMGEKRIAIYAPADATIILMDDKITYDSTTNEKIRDDYSLEFSPCRGIGVYLNHFSEISPELQAAYEQADKWCDQNQYHFGTDMSNYYSPCQAYFQLQVKAGDILGYIGTMPESVTLATSIDIGAYNYNRPPLDFINPSRYQPDNLHAMCSLDLFSSELKNAYYEKLAYIQHNVYTGEVEIAPRVGEPLCGTNMQDVAGTLQGNWYAGNKGIGSNATEYQLALVHTLINTSVSEISLEGQQELGGNVSLRFSAKHEGTINREFSEITPDDQIYCYQNVELNEAGQPVDRKGNITSDIFKYLIQLIDDTHLKIELQQDQCTENEAFNSPFIYER